MRLLLGILDRVRPIFEDGGKLIVKNKNMVEYFKDAISSGQLTGVAKEQIQMVDLDTVIVPEPGTYALLAGCFGLTWVMLRRRR